ncbi:MAG: hypothetical protein J6T80_00110 [Paludibacteraceae bacterium]|nr:hypothetical protein [Paludibacteraceae bacterium]
MKTLRYLLIVVALLSILSVSAQGLAQQPEATMHSTSTMVGSGSTLPSAAVTGVSTTYSPAKTPNGPRRAASDEDEGDTPPPDPHGPNEDPLGDVLWPLMLCACAYLIVRTAQRRKRIKE